MIEVEAVHLGAREQIVDLLGGRPRLHLQGVEAVAQPPERLVLAAHRAGAEVGGPVDDRRPFELAEFVEDLEQLSVVRYRDSSRGCGPAPEGDPGVENDHNKRNAELDETHARALAGC